MPVSETVIDEAVSASVGQQTRQGLKSRTLTNGLVTAAAQGIQLAVNVGSTVVLARLLGPKEFGMVAIVLSLMGFFRVFNDMGLSTATIQRTTITRAQISNLFWINVTSGALVTLGFAAAAPFVAWFFDEPRLRGVTLVLSLTFVIASSTVQHLALLKRDMHFGKIALIQVSSFIGGACIGVGMAFWGFSYWALVGMQLSNPLLTCVMTWMISQWRPQLPQRGTETRPLVQFGIRMAASSLIWSVARGSDTILVGKVFGSAALGLYSRAAALLIRPMDQLMSPIEAVMVPTLSRLLPEPERYRRAILELYEIIVLATFCLSGLIFALSRPMTLVLLGARWEQAAPIFAGFSLLALYIPVGSAATWLLTSQGRGKHFLSMSIIFSIATACSFVTGLAFGPTGVATAYSLSCLFICLPVLYYLIGREGPVRTSDLWRRFLTHLPLWGVVAGCTAFSVSLLRSWPALPQLVLSGAAGVVAAALFILAFPPSRRAALKMGANLLEWKASFLSKK